MVERVIKVSEFTKYPGGRWKKDGTNSGEEFRETVLKPALLAAHQNGDKIVVSLDGVAGFSSSFLEEAFGGLVRQKLMPTDELMQILSVRASESVLEGFKADALSYLERAIKNSKAA